MPDNRRRILVTGGARFIGSHPVTRLLSDGHHVGVLDDLSTESRIIDVLRLLPPHIPSAPRCRYSTPPPYDVTRHCLHNDTAATLLAWRPLVDRPTGIAHVIAELTLTTEDTPPVRDDLERIAA